LEGALHGKFADPLHYTGQDTKLQRSPALCFTVRSPTLRIPAEDLTRTMRLNLHHLLLALCAPLSLTAQIETGLPKGMAPHEWDLVPEYLATRAASARGISTPPDFPVRTMAEWEEVQALVITWTSYTGILKQIVREAKQECEVIIVCSNPTNVQSFLQNNQYGGPINDLDNITYLVAPFNSIWIRDFGPEVIYKNDVDSLFLLDWIYNRPRPADDALSDVIGDFMGITVYSTAQAPNDLVHTGGNFMADGFGTGFSSKLVDIENGPQGQFNQTNKTPAQVDAIMDSFMGISPYIKMNELPFDNISHIDMHMKLLDEETLLVGEFPTGVSDGPTLEANLAAISANNVSVFGTPYEYVRIPMVPSTAGNFPPNASYRTYANAIFINKLILVPTYREQYDTIGLRIWRESMPGYRVVGIDCDNQDQNIISASGAIHCITKTVGVADPLLIRHQRLRDTEDTANDYPVVAWMRHKSGIASARLYWTADTTQGYSVVDMFAQTGDNWAAAIPAQAAGTTVYYYVEGTANSGKTQVRPITAPQGWWRFRVLGDATGMPDVAGPEIVEVFPNPSNGMLVVTMNGTGDAPVRVYLTDALGREVMTLHQGRMHNDRRVFADISRLAEATYVLVVEGPNGRGTHRVVKH
jgi:agmatine/peptidylarginine deiminase